jgi:hypothetical protein
MPLGWVVKALFEKLGLTFELPELPTPAMPTMPSFDFPKIHISCFNRDTYGLDEKCFNLPGFELGQLRMLCPQEAFLPELTSVSSTGPCKTLIWELRMLFQLRRFLHLLFRQQIQDLRGVHGYLFIFRGADKLGFFDRTGIRQGDRERCSIQWLDGPRRRGGLVDDLVVGLLHCELRLEDLLLSQLIP